MSWLERMDRWNQRSLERSNERSHLADEVRALEHRYLERPDGRTVHVQVLPTGFPVNSYEYFDLVVVPTCWFRRKVLYPGGYQVVVSEARGHWWAGRDRVLFRGPSSPREYARAQLDTVAERFAT